MRLTLFGRHGCHLCDVMQEELGPLLAEAGCGLRIEDVDRLDAWRARYSDRVPVLVTPSGEELCHHYLDEQAVRKWLLIRG